MQVVAQLSIEDLPDDVRGLRPGASKALSGPGLFAGRRSRGNPSGREVR